AVDGATLITGDVKYIDGGYNSSDYGIDWPENTSPSPTFLAWKKQPHRRRHSHVASISRGRSCQCLQHCDPCFGDDGRHKGNAHCGRVGNVTSNASIDRSHDCRRDGLDVRAPGGGAGLVIDLRDYQYRAGRY